MKFRQTKPILVIFLSLVVVFVTGACGVLQQNLLGREDAHVVETSVAQTVEVEVSLAATEDLPEPTAQPTETPLPPVEVAELPTPINAPPKDIAINLGALTYGPGSKLFPEEPINKIWRVRNAGDTVWNGDYELVFVEGESFGSPESIRLNTELKPGEIMDLSLKLTAPSRIGTYIGKWRLRSAEGETFGFGAEGDELLELSIEVVENPLQNGEFRVLRFFENVCGANWSDQNGLALCEAEGNINLFGMIHRVSNAQIEGDVHEDEPTLVVVPPDGPRGKMTGIYPPFAVIKRDWFVARVGCLAASTDCDVIFRLKYRVVGEEEIHILGEWEQVNDGKWERVDANLNPLAGQSVEFILEVQNNGNTSNNQAVWFVPAVIRQ
ncbi:MAG: hypothetical protein JW750_00600 [Anaerolineaceae bacterium]|nr:hypothetical protein [Anaerolineaceae bacterium]